MEIIKLPLADLEMNVGQIPGLPMNPRRHPLGETYIQARRMKTVVFITGTNATGKSTVAREVAERCGGIKSPGRRFTLLNDPDVVLAGKYMPGKTYGGVDTLNATAPLAGIVGEALAIHESIICEGSYMNTFGLNLANALFQGDRQAVVFLYAPVECLRERIAARSAKNLTKETVLKQTLALRSAKKWAEIGVPVYSFDTSVTPPREIAEKVLEIIGKC